MDIAKLSAYELITKENIEDIKSVGYLLKHKKTGARVMCIENDDENKVFYVGFRTPPEDSTGVPHIIEHSVLCGSEKYPAKDPFVELAKGSNHTFGDPCAVLMARHFGTISNHLLKVFICIYRKVRFFQGMF